MNGRALIRGQVARVQRRMKRATMTAPKQDTVSTSKCVLAVEFTRTRCHARIVVVHGKSVAVHTTMITFSVTPPNTILTCSRCAQRVM